MSIQALHNDTDILLTSCEDWKIPLNRALGITTPHFV